MPKPNPFSKCEEFVNEKRSIVVAKDNASGTAYRYYNQSNNSLSKFRIDNCLVVKESKCDWLLLNCDTCQSFFIELKGSDLIKAVEQIDSAITKLLPNLTGYSVNARIVLTRVNIHDLIKIKYLRLKKRVEALNGSLLKQSQLMEESF